MFSFVTAHGLKGYKMTTQGGESTLQSGNGQFLGRIGKKTGILTHSSKKEWFIDICDDDVPVEIRICAFVFHICHKKWQD